MPVDKKKETKVKQDQEQKVDTYDENENWITSSAFIYTSKGLFPISVLKAAERKKKKATSTQLKEETSFLSQNDLVPYPFEARTLLELKDNCAFFDRCVKQIAKDVVGQGWRLELREGKKEAPKEKESILAFIENCGGDRDETFEETLERGVIDWGYIGWWGWEVSRDDKDIVNGLWHVPAQTFYLHKSHKKYCQKRGQDEAWFKRFGLEEQITLKDGKAVGEEKLREIKEMDEKKRPMLANELIYYKNYYPQSEYYGAPNILPSIGAVMGLIGVRDYNLAFFENYGIPAALIVLKGKWNQETAKQISDFIDVELKGSEQSHKTFCIHPPKDGEFEYIKLGIEVKEGSFKIYQKSLRDEILLDYSMPPYRIGVAEVGALGGSTAPEATKNYAQGVIAPLEEVVERLVTKKLFVQGLKAESYLFCLNEIDLRDLDAEAARDAIYFGLGARTSNQILKRQGKEPYAEGNQYYVSSTYLPAGEETIEKRAAILEAFKMILKGQPKVALDIVKLAKREAK